MTKFTLILISALAASSALAGAPPGVHITATAPVPQGAPPGVHITAVPRPAAMHIVIAPPVKG